ncbi:hypothetical protein V1477_021040 [Vespula maculifrons]|uniref:Uncharacterized protein n=1 Tax=Vespula maculifrons TaxID=7453 RepID=A0ABD2AGZ5_VESMC
MLTRCTVRRKLNESSRAIGNNNNNNMEITETNIENRNKYDSRMFIHGLKNELRKNGNGTKVCLTFKMNKPAETIKTFTDFRDNNEYIKNYIDHEKVRRNGNYKLCLPVSLSGYYRPHDEHGIEQEISKTERYPIVQKYWREAE